MGINRGNRDYFTIDIESPFHAGSKPAQVDFEDVFETFALRDELSSAGGNTTGWEYHHFQSIGSLTDEGFMYITIPANANNLDGVKLLMMASGSARPTFDLKVLFLSDVSSPPANTIPFSAGDQLFDILRDDFNLNTYQILSETGIPSNEASVPGVRKVTYENTGDLQVPLISNNRRLLMVDIRISAGTILTNFRAIGLRYS